MATAALLRSLRRRDVATASLSAYRSPRSTVKSSPQGHDRWISLARPFSSSTPVGNYGKGNDLGTTNSSVVVTEKEAKLEDRAHFEIRKHTEMVIWDIQMIKRYRNKIPREIIERIEAEVLDLRKTMGRRSVISEMKSKLDEYLSRWQNDQRFWGSRDHSGGDEQGGYYRGEASWDHSGSDIHTMTKSMETRFQVTRQEKLRVQLQIWKRQWKEEMLMKLRPSLMMKTKLSQRLGSTCTVNLNLKAMNLATKKVVSRIGNAMKARLLNMIRVALSTLSAVSLKLVALLSVWLMHSMAVRTLLVVVLTILVVALKIIFGGGSDSSGSNGR